MWHVCDSLGLEFVEIPLIGIPDELRVLTSPLILAERVEDFGDILKLALDFIVVKTLN